MLAERVLVWLGKQRPEALRAAVLVVALALLFTLAPMLMGGGQ